MQDMTEELLAQSRAYSTNEERTVLALEAIADQLRSLIALLAPAAIPEVTRARAPARETNATDEGAWENEGGSLANRTAASLGIKHSMTDQFETGGYRYTNLADAIAQTKRAGACSLS
jgi:hypothetical protein